MGGALSSVKLRSANQGGPAILRRFEFNGREVELTFGLLLEERMLDFVDHMARNRPRGDGSLRIRCLEEDRVVAESRNDRVSTRRWHCGHARALKDLAHVKRESPVEPLPNRKAAKDRGIAGSPGDDYFCAGLQGGYVRTGAHLGDDRPAGRDGFFGYG